jgi:hypothetical protein
MHSCAAGSATARGVLQLDGAVAGAGACGHPRAVYLAVPACPEIDLSGRKRLVKEVLDD